MTEEPVPVVGESRKEALRYLEMIRRDLARLPVLDAQKTRWAKPPRGIGRGRNKKRITATEFDRLFERGEGVETLDCQSATVRSPLKRINSPNKPSAAQAR